MLLSNRRHPLLTDLGLLAMRLMLAAVFIFHGAQKLFGVFGGRGITGTAELFNDLNLPAPMISVVAAGAVELFGGLALLIGNGTRLAAALLAGLMAVAALHVHGHAFDMQNNGMEYPLTLAAVSFGLFLTGPGRCTIGRACRRTRAQSSRASIRVDRRPA